MTTPAEGGSYVRRSRSEPPRLVERTEAAAPQPAVTAEPEPEAGDVPVPAPQPDPAAQPKKGK